MLSVGDQAPNFQLPSTSGKVLSLESLRGQKVVLYFYPKDQTPGCTQEACDFRDSMGQFSEEGITILGISPDSIASHQRFQQKQQLPFELLSDADRSVAESYGAYGEKKMYGKTSKGIIRSTFLIDEQGKIAAVWSPVTVKGHIAAVLKTLQAQ
jgi:peroxiredoxin Q/BCP